MPYDVLRKAVGTAVLDTGDTISPETARHLACDAELIPAVLDSAGQVLDIGRERRNIPTPIRRALILRDKGCAFPACDRPARWTDAHHIDHWSNGGPTAIHNLVLLCRRHHQTVHHTEWAVRIAADGIPEFTPPAWIDQQQTPRRNKLHRRE